MGKKLLLFLGALSRPLRKNAVFFGFMYLLFVLCFYAEPGVNASSLRYAELYVDLFAVCLVLGLLPRRLRRWLRSVLAVFLFVVTLADCFVYSRFDSPLTPTMLQLVLETDPREAGEFLDTYLCNRQTGILFMWFALLGALYILAERFSFRLRRWACRWLPDRKGVMEWAKALFSLLVWGGLAVALTTVWEEKRHTFELLSQESTNEMERMYNKGYSTGLYNPAYRFYFSLYANALTWEQTDRLKRNVARTRVDSCSFRSPHIVLIIGESYNKKHASLYGYTHATTPRQCARADRGELIPFTDVVTPWNLTSHVFKNVFSLYSYGEPGDWCDHTLFPAVFRRAGYRVTFLTNQFVQSPGENAFDFSGGYFLNDEELSRRQFDVRNTAKHAFDEGLLADYDSLCGTGGGLHSLIIFHLLGQHVGYDCRYPAHRRVFGPADYDRPDMNPEQLRQLADYDNATLYNDSVVDAILTRFEQEDAVVIYMPDHGEEVFDGIRHFGRLHSSALRPRLVENEFEIPFWIWCSAAFRAHRPELVAEIEAAARRPFMTDDLPHMLFYLAGISCPGYDETRALMSSAYNARRKRLLKGIRDYDRIMEQSSRPPLAGGVLVDSLSAAPPNAGWPAKK